MIDVTIATTIMPYIPKITDSNRPKWVTVVISPNPMVVTSMKQYHNPSKILLIDSSAYTRTIEKASINNSNPKIISPAYVLIMTFLSTFLLKLERASEQILTTQVIGIIAPGKNAAKKYFFLSISVTFTISAIKITVISMIRITFNKMFRLV